MGSAPGPGAPRWRECTLPAGWGLAKEREHRRFNCLFPAFSSPGKSKEAEIKRINKELANIRSKFKGRLESWVSGRRGLGA